MQNKRQSQVGELIKRNFSQVLQEEGAYIYHNALVTVTKVLMSPDLSYAKIYLSVYNRDDKALVIQELVQEKNRLKSNLSSRIRKHVRRIPDIDFFLDDTLDEMYRLNNLFDQIHDKKG
ncbi:MAG TPA: 30S ribosome-binding factor RbfA [Membranihabitans sp.]|nr:30S ribosome-binding factor RbfA [Membranihabitans sp.]